VQTHVTPAGYAGGYGKRREPATGYRRKALAALTKSLLGIGFDAIDNFAQNNHAQDIEWEPERYMKGRANKRVLQLSGD
jgi:hypothetical protein